MKLTADIIFRRKVIVAEIKTVTLYKDGNERVVNAGDASRFINAGWSTETAVIAEAPVEESTDVQEPVEESKPRSGRRRSS